MNIWSCIGFSKVKIERHISIPLNCINFVLHGGGGGWLDILYFCTWQTNQDEVHLWHWMKHSVQHRPSLGFEPGSINWKLRVKQPWQSKPSVSLPGKHTSVLQRFLTKIIYNNFHETTTTQKLPQQSDKQVNATNYHVNSHKGVTDCYHGNQDQ
jgi:hypothetical protein